jgi:hypothetical protein
MGIVELNSITSREEHRSISGGVVKLSDDLITRGFIKSEPFADHQRCALVV